MQTAELVSVVDEALVAITVEVGPPAEISGTVLDQVGDGILNLTVELWLVDGVVPISLTVVALDGSFIFADLLGGEYTLHFVKTGDNAIDEWYGGGTNSSDSEAISLLPGEVVMIDTTFETPRIGRVSTALPTDTATNAAGCYEFFGSDGQLLDSHIGPLGASSALFTAVAGTEVKVRFRECGFVNDDRLYPYDWAGPTSESSFDEAATFAVIPYVTTEANFAFVYSSAFFDPVGRVAGFVTDQQSGLPLAATLTFHDEAGASVGSAVADWVDGISRCFRSTLVHIR
jgi:hypothetical protein